MPLKKARYIWMDGKYVKWDNAKIHVLSHVIHYGSSVFEGIRAYNTKKGTAVFRLQEHIERLFNSAKIYRMRIPFSQKEIIQAILKLIKKNGHKACYIRPVVYRGYSQLGVNPFPCPVNITLATWEWGKYLGPEALERGVDVMVSSWSRMAPNTFPAMAKAGANYMNSQLIKMEALTYGFTEGIALDVNGFVSEGSGENLFLVKDEKLITPPLGSTILPGITRDSVITICKEFGLEVIENLFLREFLYIADELFFTGSAAEVTPIRSVDKIKIGKGKRGPITKKIQKRYLNYANAEKEDIYNWLTYV
ncbi:MAG: branched-chain amino acid transaminase [Candidatus Cloacimonadota bacterium]|nr:MAG: branched-chain amino acid transaminase [Candidatus Cloacimonadota bacterium]